MSEWSLAFCIVGSLGVIAIILAVILDYRKNYSPGKIANNLRSHEKSIVDIYERLRSLESGK